MRHPVLAWILLMTVITACSQELPIETDASNDDVDWNVVDWRLPRRTLAAIRTFLYFNNYRIADPVRAYREASRYAAEWDSLGQREFAQRPRAEQEARRRAAADLARRGRIAVLDPANRIWLQGRDGMVPVLSPDSPPPVGSNDAVTRSLHHLTQAVGTDPTNVDAWRNFAFMQGTAGDRSAQQRSLEQLLRASDGARPRYAGWRHRARLDLAWLARERGDHEACLAELDSLGREPGRIDKALRQEALLVRGLVHAERGDWVEAHEIAGRLAHVMTSRQSSDRRKLNKHGWLLVDSDFMARWVLAWSDIADGRPAEAERRLRGLRPWVAYPAGLAARFWQDQGFIFEAAHDRERAGRCFSAASIYHPFCVYFPSDAYGGPATILGFDGTDGPFQLGYRLFFTSGSLFGYAAGRAIDWEVSAPGAERDRLWQAAHDGLSACIARHLHETAARGIRGRMRLLAGYTADARADLAACDAALPATSPAKALVVLNLGLAQLQMGDDRSAATTLARHVALDSTSVKGWDLRGIAEARCDSFDAALSSLARARDLAPASGLVAYNTGLVLLNSRRYAEAESSFVRAATLMPGDARVAPMLEVAKDLRDGKRSEAVQLDVSRMTPTRVVRARRTNAHTLADAEAVLALLPNWIDGDHAVVADSLAADYREAPTEARRLLLCLACLQAERPERVQRLLAPAWPALDDAATILLLRADHTLGVATRALDIVGELDGEPDPRPDAELWALVVAICLDRNHIEPARRALARARELDPDNRALAIQSSLLDSQPR